MLSTRALSLTLPLLFVAAGCTRGGAQVSAEASTESSTPMLTDGAPFAMTRPAMRPFRHQGLGGLALNASHETKLTPEQIASVEQIQAQLASGDMAARTTSQEFQTHIASAIRAGKFDATELHADYASYDAMKHGEQDREADALNALHALLTPEQRTTVASAVRTRQNAVDAQKPPELPDGGVSDRVKQTLTHMTQDLTLDAGQQKRVSDLLAKDERITISSSPARKDEQKKHVDAFLAHFEEADFDAKTLDSPDAGAKAPHDQMEKEVAFLSQLVTVLKPDQREKLATERTPGPQPPRHMMGPGMGGPGMGGPGMGGPGMGGPGASMPPGHP